VQNYRRKGLKARKEARKIRLDKKARSDKKKKKKG